MRNLNRLESILQVIAFTAIVIALGIGLVHLSMVFPLMYAIPLAVFWVSGLLVGAIKVIRRSN